MSRNMLYLILGAVIAATVIGGYWFYQEQNKAGIEINVGGSGLSIKEN